MLGLAPFGALFCFPRSTLGGPVSVAAIDSEAADASTACVDGRFVKFLIDFPNPHDGSAARLRHGFGPPLRSLAAHAPEQVRGVLDAVQQAAQAGLWCLGWRSEEHTSELQSPCNLVCRLLLEKKKKQAVSPLAHIPRCTLSVCGVMLSLVLVTQPPH